MLKIYARAVLILLTGIIGMSLAAQGIGGVLNENMIAYMAQTGTITDLYLMDVERANSVNLTRTPVIYESHPTWSPDGRFLLFDRMDTIGQQACVIAPFESWIPRCFELPDRYVEHAGWDENPAVALIFRRDVFLYAAANALTGEILEGYDTSNEWLSYSKDRRYRISFVTVDFVQQIQVQDRVEDRSWRVFASEYFTTRPVISPDGMQIAFSAIAGTDTDIELYVIDTAEGSTPRQITFNDQRLDESPTWSPDGAWIAFLSDRDPGVRRETHLYMIRADGSDVRRLTYAPMNHFEPAWMP